MLQCLIIQKPIYPKNIALLLMTSILMIGMGVFAHRLGVGTIDAGYLQPTTLPLLLNSRVVETKNAEVNIILWFENNDIPPEIWTNRPMPDWTWTYKEQQTASGKVAVTLSGHRSIDKNEESNLYTWYTMMAQQLAQTGGRAYLDERVPQAMDVSAYLSKMNILPVQWALSGSLLSIAGYQKDLQTSVIAGQDRINIQLLSRGKQTAGQTILALPVLLEEF